MATKAKKDVAVQEPQPTANVPATQAADAGALILVGDKQDLSHIKQGAQRGNENVQQDDLVIPRLEIVQSVSPQLDPNKPEYNTACKQGDLINSVTNESYGREVFVVPVTYNKQWLVWRDRKQGGGFNGSFQSPMEAEVKVKELGGADKGFEAVDTPTHLCLIVNPNSRAVDEIILSMPRTKAKVSRAWNSMIRMTGQDRFARVYRISTASETNPKGTFYNYVVSSVGAPAKVLYDRAEKLYQQVEAGAKRVVMDVKGYNSEQNGDTPDAEM